MELLRICERNDINTRMNSIKLNISRNETTIERLKSQEKTEFNARQIDKLNEKNKSYNIELEELKNRILDVNSGKLDEEFKNNSKNAVLQQNKNEDKMKQKADDKQSKKNEEKIYIQKSRDGPNYLSESQKKYEIKCYFRLNNSIPDYIICNLETMPSNKGYIWKGIWCFGKLPEEPNKPLIMFEKLQKGVLRIYESDKFTRNIFEKQPNGRKVLISSEPRKQINNSLSYFSNLF